MVLQGGGEKVFPSGLMITRKTKTGLIFPVFLSEENNDYIQSVFNVFNNNINNKKENIEKDLKELEIKSSNTKIIKALSLVFFRNSIFEPAVEVNAESLREDVFKAARIPPIDNEDKETILKPVEEKYDLSVNEIIDGLYSDKDSELLLKKIYSKDFNEIARIYNLGQMETILLKCMEMTVINSSDWNYTLRSIKRLGLLYKTVINDNKLESIKVTGPTAMFENTDRYGNRFAFLIEKLYTLNEWSIEADIKIKDKYKDTTKIYKLKLSDNISYYLPENHYNDEIKYDFIKKSEPLVINNNVYFPDYIMNINNKKIYINVSNIKYIKDDEILNKELKKHVDWETIYIINEKDKKPKNYIYFINDIDFISLKKIMEDRYNTGNNLKKELDDSSIESIKKELEKLYPDTDKMINYIESQGLVPERLLPALGYKLKWKGLDLLIVKK